RWRKRCGGSAQLQKKRVLACLVLPERRIGTGEGGLDGPGAHPRIPHHPTDLIEGVQQYWVCGVQSGEDLELLGVSLRAHLREGGGHLDGEVALQEAHELPEEPGGVRMADLRLGLVLD